MFDFFEGLIEKLGVKLISDFTDKIYDWIKDIKKNTSERLRSREILEFNR